MINIQPLKVRFGTGNIQIIQTITPRDKRDAHETITLGGDTNAAIDEGMLQLMTNFYHV